jgi:hypothetical protein
MNRTTPMKKEDDVRETPPELFAARAALVREGYFTLDACATHKNTKVPSHYYTEGGLWRARGVDGEPECLDMNTDGLRGAWRGRVWVNPPFSDLWTWVDKCWRACACDAAGLLELIDFLMPATRCEQEGWQEWVEPFRDGRAELVPGWRLDTTFLAGRQHFLKDGKPIMSEPKISKRTGMPLKATRSAPKFGCVMLTWTRVPTNLTTPQPVLP